MRWYLASFIWRVWTTGVNLRPVSELLARMFLNDVDCRNVKKTRWDETIPYKALSSDKQTCVVASGVTRVQPESCLRPGGI